MTASTHSASDKNAQLAAALAAIPGPRFRRSAPITEVAAAARKYVLAGRNIFDALCDANRDLGNTHIRGWQITDRAHVLIGGYYDAAMRIKGAQALAVLDQLVGAPASSTEAA